MIGSWSVPFVILFSVTGIWYFAERTNLGGVSRIANTRAPEIEAIDVPDSLFSKFSYQIDYDRAAQVAKERLPGLEVKDIFPPGNSKRTIYVTGTSNVALVRNRANRVYVHPITYEVVKVQDAHEIGTIMWLNDIADPLHFGNWGGLITKFLWFIAGLVISGLTLTGIWIALKKRDQNKKMAQTQRLGRWKYYNWITVGIMLFFMYGTMVVRYAAPPKVFVITNIIFGLCFYLTWYVFVKKLKVSKS